MFEALAEISEALSDNLDINPEKADSVLDKFNDSFEESDDDSDEVPDEIQDSNEGPATDNDMILDKINDDFDLDHEVGEFDESESDSESDHYESVLDKINSDSLENETESNLADVSDSFENNEDSDQSEQNEAQTRELTEEEKNALKEKLNWTDKQLSKCTIDENGVIHYKTDCEHMEGKETEGGVRYERKTVDIHGTKVEGVFPVFDSTFDVQLPEDMEKSSNTKQFRECNNQLGEAIKNDPELKEKFTAEQLEDIENGDTPTGYVWHHSEETGKMQLVKIEDHDRTQGGAAHTGGKSLWGGGYNNNQSSNS